MRMVHPILGTIAFSEIRKFIVEGKKQGWASGKIPTLFRDGSEGYNFNVHVRYDISLLYQDSYIGQEGFIGTEIVYAQKVGEEKIPIWGMNYSDVFKLPQGFNTSEEKPFKKETMKFLKDCLLQVSEDFPFRGPVGRISKEVMGRNLRYINVPSIKTDISSIGDYQGGDRAIRDFRGIERISMTDTRPGIEIFHLTYQGRVLVPDKYIQE